jgi:2,3-diketo-5-methylthio-1-phosphopentane phosphatase
MKPVVFCDFDGTITQVDVTDLMLTKVANPSWREVEQEWRRGLIGSRECLERQMALVEASEAQLNALIDSVALDPHFLSFYGFLEKRRIPFYVVSDGFDYVVRRLLKRAGIDGQLRNGVRLFASGLNIKASRLVTSFPHAIPDCQHGCATCKAAIVRRLTGGRRTSVFIGDGLSDRFAAEESSLVFAKRELLAYCRDRGIACHAFETFAEVEWELRKLISAGVPGEVVKGRKAKLKGQKVLLPSFNP